MFYGKVFTLTLRNYGLVHLLTSFFTTKSLEIYLDVERNTLQSVLPREYQRNTRLARNMIGLNKHHSVDKVGTCLLNRKISLWSLGTCFSMEAEILIFICLQAPVKLKLKMRKDLSDKEITEISVSDASLTTQFAAYF